MFKVGDRVEMVNADEKVQVGDVGTVLEESHVPYVAFDRNIGGHNAWGRCEWGYGWAIDEYDIKLIEEAPTCATTA